MIGQDKRALWSTSTSLSSSVCRPPQRAHSLIRILPATIHLCHSAPRLSFAILFRPQCPPVYTWSPSLPPLSFLAPATSTTLPRPPQFLASSPLHTFLPYDPPPSPAKKTKAAAASVSGYQLPCCTTRTDAAPVGDTCSPLGHWQEPWSGAARLGGGCLPAAKTAGAIGRCDSPLPQRHPPATAEVPGRSGSPRPRR